jgi:HTH-type transcriptional regulator, sugar sensing transcriptional regulator
MVRKFTIDTQILELLDLKEKDALVYTTLLRLGSAPLRRIAQAAKLNRGTAYDALKRLLDAKLVQYVDAKRHRYFHAEEPAVLRGLAMRKELAMQEARAKLTDVIPELQSMIGVDAHRPRVRYFEGESGVKDLLKDVLLETSKTRAQLYRVYSSSGIRDLIAHAWPSYNTQRKKRQVRVRAIAIGPGGKTHGLDDRRWLSHAEAAPTYIFVYGKKTAYVAADEHDQLFGVTIEDAAITATQKMIFDALWKQLGT